MGSQGSLVGMCIVSVSMAMSRNQCLRLVRMAKPPPPPGEAQKKGKTLLRSECKSQWLQRPPPGCSQPETTAYRGSYWTSKPHPPVLCTIKALRIRLLCCWYSPVRAHTAPPPIPILLFSIVSVSVLSSFPG